MIPTFAVERAQEIIYYISQLHNENRIPQVPVYLDSPMAVDVTSVPTLFDDRRIRALGWAPEHSLRDALEDALAS